MREYDAFISYRHVYPDIRVANRLHKILEDFRLPGSLATECEKPPKWKIFMDNWELPVSSDLYTSIHEALQSSRFLLVICSAKTPESVWVEQETVTFAELHGWNHILPLLIEGTPEQSFPRPILAHGQIPYLDLSGESSHRRINGDLRRRRAWLAARLAGCDYDRLWKRLRAGDRQRAVAVTFFTVIAMAAVSLYSLAIRDSAMENQRQIAVSDEENRQSIEAAESYRLAYEEAEQSVQAAIQNKNENTLWAQLATAEEELKRGNRRPAAAMAEAFLQEPGISEPMQVTARTLMEEARTEGYLTKVFGYYSAWFDVRFTPDSRIMLLSESGSGTLHSYPTDTFIRQAVRQEQRDFMHTGKIAVSESGHYAGVTLNGEDNVLLFAPDTLEVLGRCRIPERNDGHQVGFQYAFLPDTETFYTTVQNEGLYKINIVAQKSAERVSAPVKNRFQSAFPLTDSLFLLFNGYGGNNEKVSDEAILFDAETGAETPLGNMYENVFVDYSPDRHLVAFWSDHPNSPYYTFERESGAILFSDNRQDCHDIAFSPDGSLIAIAHYNNIELIETAGFTVVRNINLPGAKRSLAFMKDDVLACSRFSLDDGSSGIMLMDVNTGRILADYETSPNEIRELILSPNGELLVSCTDTEMIVWQVGLPEQ